MKGNRGQMRGKQIHDQVAFVGINGHFAGTLLIDTPGISILVRQERICRKTYGQKRSQDKPFIDEYPFHVRWFIGFDEGREVDVTGFVKKVV